MESRVEEGAVQQRLVAIRTKLDRLRSLDPHRRVFGARRIGNAGHDYRERPTLGASDLASLEAEYDVELPEELRAFLRGVHGGGPGPGYGLDLWGERPKTTRPFPYTMDDFAELLVQQKQDRYAALPMTEDDEDQDGDEDGCWPPGSGFMPLAHHGCGVYDVIIVNGPLRGSIWCCDMAWRPFSVDGRLLSFLDWYEEWLDRNLTPQAIERLAAASPST